MSNCILNKQNNRQSANFKGDYPDPKIFFEKLDELKHKLPPVFESFEKSFILYNNNSDDNEYEQIFNNDKANLEGIISDQFLLENTVTTTINDVNSDLARLYMEIEVLKKENQYLKKTMKAFDQRANTTDEMFDNHKEFYEIQYLRNWATALSIVISLGIMTSVFAPAAVVKGVKG
jgi:hypothetical protein